MAIIGTFTKQNDGYTGALKTLTVVTSIASVVSLPLVILASFVL